MQKQKPIIDLAVIDKRLQEIELELEQLTALALKLDLDTAKPHINPDDKWCIYLSIHPLGFYYYGKGITKNVMAGLYKGSGTKLVAAWEWYPKDEWYATVLETFPAEPLNENKKDPGELKAYQRERELISFDMLCDPFCMNDVPGGKGGGSWGKVSTRNITRRKKAISETWDEPETKERHRLGALSDLTSAAAREKRREFIRHSWAMKRKVESFKQQVDESKTQRAAVLVGIKEANVLTKADALKAPTQSKQDRLKAELTSKFPAFLADGVWTLDVVLKVKETVDRHKKSLPKIQLKLAYKWFTEWLDANDIIRAGSERHKELLNQQKTQEQLDKELRIAELEAAQLKLLKTYPKVKQYERDDQLTTQKTACLFCSGQFRPMCFSAYREVLSEPSCDKHKLDFNVE